MAFLRRRGKFKYYSIYYYTPGSASCKTHPLKTSDLAEAKKALKIFEAKLRLKLVEENPVMISVMTISRAYEKYKANNDFAKGSLMIKNNMKNHLIAALGDKRIDQLSVLDQGKFRNHLREAKVSKNSIEIYTTHAVAFFNWLKKNRYIKDHPFEKIRGEKKLVRTIPADDLNQIIESLTNPLHRFIVLFLLLSGRRVGELYTLKCSQIDMKKKIIVFRNHKAKRDLVLPIITPLYYLLETQDLSREFLIPFRSYYTIGLFWKRKMAQLNMRYTLHQLRKTCATYLLMQGVNILTVKSYLDHSDIKVTEAHYFEMMNEQMRQEIDSKADFKFLKQRI